MPKKTKPTFAGLPGFEPLKQHLSTPIADRGVEWEHQLGELVDKLCPRGKRAYGAGGIETLAEELDAQHISPNRLWLARKLAIAVSRSELKRLTQLAANCGFALGSSHVLSLAAVKDSAERESLGIRCIEREWTVVQLRREIQMRQGKLSGGGTKVRQVRSVDEALLDLIERSKTWLSRYEQAWFGESAKSLSRPMSRAATERLSGKLDEAISVLAELQKAAESARRRLRQQRTGTARDEDPGTAD